MKVTVTFKPTGPDKPATVKNYENVTGMGIIPPALLKLEGGGEAGKVIALIPIEVLWLLEAPENDTQVTLVGGL